MSKDYDISGDDGWWTGMINGKIGIFPFNFAAPLNRDFSNLPREQLLQFSPPNIAFSELLTGELIGKTVNTITRK